MVDTSSPALYIKTAIVGALIVTLYMYRRQQTRRNQLAAHRAAVQAATLMAAKTGTASAPGGKGAGGAAAEAEEEGAGDRPRLTVLFASQTGTAEGFATAVGQEARQQGFHATVACVEDYADDDIEQLHEEKLLVVIAATYGEGEPTDDALAFTKWLRREDAPADSLAELHYAVFGLGDRSYEKYCAMGHEFHERLEALGGHPLIPAGEGDDSADIEGDFTAWKRAMWGALRTHAFGAEAGAAVTYKLTHEEQSYSFEFPAPSQPQFVATLAPPKAGEPEPADLRASWNPIIDNKPWVQVSVRQIRELHTKRSPRSCMHVELDLRSAAKTSLLHTQYEAGDHAALLSENEPEHAAALARRLRCEMADTLRVEASAGASAVRRYMMPTPCSVRRALLSLLDISRPPSAPLLLVLAEHATDSAEKASLLRLASQEGAEEYAALVAEQQTLLEMLRRFPSVDVSLTHIVEHLPRLQPRFYSISSSPRAHKQQVHITAALVEYEKEGQEKGRVYTGMVTGWLQRFMQRKDGGVGQKLRLYLRKSPFKLPRTNPKTLLATPVILIGPGTGLAPFRGFLHERQAAGDTGQSVLYFGCRSVHEDYIYREELEGFEADGTLSALHVAFSRDSQEKVYVQDLLRRDGAKIWQQLEAERAVVYVCGDAKRMAADVSAALHSIAEKEGGLAAEQAAGYVAELKKTGRYLQDIW